MSAWLIIMRDRLSAAVPIAVVLALSWRVMVQRRVMALVWQVAAMTVGAGAGELLLDRASADAAGRDDYAILGEIARWTLIGLTVTAFYVSGGRRSRRRRPRKRLGRTRPGYGG